MFPHFALKELDPHNERKSVLHIILIFNMGDMYTKRSMCYDVEVSLGNIVLLERKKRTINFVDTRNSKSHSTYICIIPRVRGWIPWWPSGSASGWWHIVYCFCFLSYRVDSKSRYVFSILSLLRVGGRRLNIPILKDTLNYLSPSEGGISSNNPPT
jgi:hypothetical protein